MTSQLQLINKILETKNYGLITLNNLTEDFFFNYPAEFTFIRNHYKSYQSVPDKLTFLNNFPNFDIIEVTEPDSYLVSAVIEDYTNKYIAENYNKVRAAFEKGDTEDAKYLLRQAAENMPKGGALQCVDIMADTSRFDRYEERMSNYDNSYIRTGFPELDRLIGGIDRKNENMVIAARTGIGKTWTLCKMAAEACMQGLNVGFYSGEMSVDKVGYRVDTLIGHIQNMSIARGFTDVNKEYKQYITNLPNMGYGSFKVLTPAMIAGPATVSALQAFVERYNLDILFIDQYSLLEDESRAKVAHEKVANISKAIKNLQVLKEIPIISVAQLNRTKNEDGSQDTTQIGLSDRIGQDATSIIMLDKKENVFTLNIVKARDGGDGKKLEYSVDLNRGTFAYIPSEGDNISSEEDLDEIRNSYDNTPPWETTSEDVF